MLGSALRSILQRPVVAPEALRENRVRQPAFFHHPMHDWERRLHIGLRITWPCEASLEFQSLWQSVNARVRSAAAMGAERLDESGLNPELSRAVWCLVRHLKPRTIVEAGVGHGVVSRFILEALALNGSGQLYSIAPPAVVPQSNAAVAVEPRVADRWSLIADTPRRSLPALLSRLGSADLVIHDSRQTDQEMRFEIDYSWIALKSGGTLVLNNIDMTGSLQYFTQRYPGHHVLVCEAKPAHPDPDGADRASLFAIVFKNPKAI